MRRDECGYDVVYEIAGVGDSGTERKSVRKSAVSQHTGVDIAHMGEEPVD